jgi:hypothetical protein
VGGEILSLDATGTCTTIQFHPHSGSIVSTSTDKSIDIFTLEKASPSISLVANSSKQHTWSPLSGSQLVSHSAKNIISIYDPRASLNAQLDINTMYQANRPSYSTYLDDVTLLSTGTIPSTRTRTLALYDIRSPSHPKSTTSFDPSSSPSISLVPLIDPIRRLAYCIQSHSSSIFAFDLNETNPLPTVLHLPSTIVGAALLPCTKVDVMKAEINRLYVLTRKDEIVPVSVRIERKVSPNIYSADERVIWIFMRICSLMCLFRKLLLPGKNGLLVVPKFEKKCLSILRDGVG